MKNLKFLGGIVLCLFVLVACKQEPNATKGEIKKPYLYKAGKYHTSSGKLFREVIFLTDSTKKMLDYYTNGAIRKEQYFKHDLQEGLTKIFYETGELKELQYYTQGNRTKGDTVFRTNGTIEYIWTFDNNLKNGPMFVFDSNGKVINHLVFKDDEIIEANGQPVSKPARKDSQIFLGKYDRKGPVQNIPPDPEVTD